jgi:hypothetical protein
MKLTLFKKAALAVVFLLLILPGVGYCGWTLWVSTYDECMDKYLEDTKCNRGTQILAVACSNLYGKETLKDSDKDLYECWIDNAISMENALAVNLVVARCFEKNK